MINGNNSREPCFREIYDFKKLGSSALFLSWRLGEGGFAGLVLPVVINSTGWLCNWDAAVCRSAAQRGKGLG